MAIITLGGHLGAGKTVLAGKLATALGYEELYMGGLFRELAAEQGMSIEVFYQAIERNPELEKSLDRRQADIMRTKDNMIVQGRIAWFFAKESPFAVFNVCLTVDPHIGAERSAKRPENMKKPIEAVLRANEERSQRELDRYRALYGIDDFLDPGHYDFVLDTTRLTEEGVLRRVIEKIKEQIEGDV